MSFRISKLRGMTLQDYIKYKELVLKFHAEENLSLKEELKTQIQTMHTQAKEKCNKK